VINREGDGREAFSLVLCPPGFGGQVDSNRVDQRIDQLLLISCFPHASANWG
jgi:hypothetical protein